MHGFGLKSNSAIKSTSLGVFSTQFDATTSLQTPANIAASAVLTRFMAGNFQKNNFGKGGKDRDGIEVYIHHNGFTSNADCFTLFDGQNGIILIDAVGEKERHNLGEIWTTMLLEVYWNLVEEYGFSANLHDATQKKGNIIFLQLFVGTLMIQP
ncbi:hypothetical protein BASA83_012336 [Batrachochytrium salamandrivorans]|nr:hypothetical protein BASA83_012336 [Batrachochytrium salamandrivorans]